MFGFGLGVGLGGREKDREKDDGKKAPKTRAQPTTSAVVASRFSVRPFPHSRLYADTTLVDFLVCLFIFRPHFVTVSALIYDTHNTMQATDVRPQRPKTTASCPT